ncbi:NrdI-like flavodoxin [Microbacterium phage Zooman]|nr:NrdI-like flavodoxin [Microbacterium phage Zooman]
MNLVYFSSVSENTHRFVKKLELPATRIPVLAAQADSVLQVEPFILFTPTYGGGSRKGADVPKQVIRFLNVPENRALLRGVVSSGNTNFGADFCRAGDVISEKCQVPVLYRFELLGTQSDVTAVQSIMEKI